MRAIARPLMTAALLIGTVACAPSGMQTASSDRCRQFALSGGYPILRGGPIHGPNSTLEELPGAPPLWLGGFGEPGIQAHLDEQDYLEAWCLRNLSQTGCPADLVQCIAVVGPWNSGLAIF